MKARDGSPVEAVRILLVEDNAGDIDLVKVALEQFSVPHVLDVVTDGERAVASVLGAAPVDPLPDLIILDLNVPKIDGRSVLAAIKGNERTRQIPVIVFTSSAAERDIFEAYRGHANCCITKPSNIRAFFDAFAMIEKFWLQLVRLPARSDSR